MKRVAIALLAATGLSVGFSQIASAADLPVKGPVYTVPVAAPPYNWTGFYVGAHAGYSWSGGSSSYDNPALAGFDINMKPSGALGGVQGGFNYQLPNNIVVGVEADFSWADISDTIPDTLGNALHHPGWPNLTITSKTDYGGTARARLGYAFGQFLPYLTGGYAWTHANISATDGSLSESANYSGWTIGGGTEYAFTEHVAVKAEYLHSEFGSHDFFSGKPYSSTSKPNSDTVRVGINFRPW